MSTEDPKVQEARRALDALIVNATGEHRAALVLFRDESKACEFWLGEAEAMMDAVQAAAGALPDGPVRRSLVDAIRAAHQRVAAYHRANGWPPFESPLLDDDAPTVPSLRIVPRSAPPVMTGGTGEG